MVNLRVKKQFLEGRKNGYEKYWFSNDSLSTLRHYQKWRKNWNSSIMVGTTDNKNLYIILMIKESIMDQLRNGIQTGNLLKILILLKE